jgi:hypothetical protein
MVFVETAIFTRLATALLADVEYGKLQSKLADQPDAGALLKGGAGLRKLRWSSSGRGKSGGIRVIYYWHANKSLIVMFYIFAKNDRTDLSRSDLHALADLARSMK